MDRLKKLQSLVSLDNNAVMLAEEAAELAQAAAKYYRVGSKSIPTPVTAEEAWDNLVEEYTDVVVTAKVMGLEIDQEIFESKTERWLERIENKLAE